MPATKKAQPNAPAKPAEPLNVYQLINIIQGELAREGIGKDSRNKQQGYAFRGIDQVYNALSLKLSNHGLVILPNTVERVETSYKAKSGANSFHVVLTLDFTFIAAAMPESTHTVRITGEGMDVGDKASNKALSAAYKYAVINSFAIPVQGQDDPDAQSPEAYENVAGVDVNTQTGEISPPAEPQPDELITGQDAINIAMLVKKSGITETDFFKWVKAPKGDYTAIRMRMKDHIISVLDDRIKKAEIEAKQNDGEFDDDIPF